MIYPVLLPHLRVAYDLDLATAGLLLSVMFFAYAFGQLPGGVLADRFGEGRIMVVSTAITILTIILVSTAGSSIILFAATGLFGFGTGLFAVARFTSLADIYPDHVGTSFGVINAASDAGQALLPPIAGLLAVTFAWQFGFGFTIPFLFLVTIGLWVAVPARTSGPTSAVDTITLDSARYVLGALNRPSLIVGTMILILGHSIWQAFTGFYPTYLIEIKGLSSTIAGIIFGMFFALGVLIKPLSGIGYDQIGTKWTTIILMSITCGGLLILPFVESLILLIGVTMLVSTVLGYGTVLTSYVTVALPDDMRGTGLGTIRTIYWMISSMSPLLFGLLADRGYFDQAFLVLGGLAGIMILLSFWLPAKSNSTVA